MKVISRILLIVFLQVANNSAGQFYGGNYDGSCGGSSGLSILNEQFTYCSGGQADGYSAAQSPFYPISGQTQYSSGGNGDGFSCTTSDCLIMNSQAMYCFGGQCDGYSSSMMDMAELNNQGFYCQGGNADGFGPFHLGQAPLNSQAEYCVGGSFDGVSSASIFEYINDPSPYCSGGVADGSTASLFVGLMFQPYFCLGGAGDGWNGLSSGMASVNLQGFYCDAGQGDGYDAQSYNGSLPPVFIYCFGGASDGYGASSPGNLNMGYGIWTGLSSSTWTVATNWKYNTVPTVNTNVLIPAGAPSYPVILETFSINSNTGTYKCKRLDILTGGQITSSRNMTIDGIVNISGVLTFQHLFYNYLQINPGGHLNVKQGGVILLD